MSTAPDSTPSRLVRLKPVTIVPVWLLRARRRRGHRRDDDGRRPLHLAVRSPSAASILLTFVLQLAASEKDGLVSRTMLALCGSLVLLASTTGVVALLR